MSGIPVSKRKESNLETLHLAYRVRRQISDLAANGFYCNVNKQIGIFLDRRGITDATAREETAAKLTARAEWFIEREGAEAVMLCKQITRHLRMGNTIYPNYYQEFVDRRMEMNEALKANNALQDELNYIGYTLHGNLNKYKSIVLELDEIFNKTKKLRKDANKYLPRLKDFPEQGKNQGQEKRRQDR